MLQTRRNRKTSKQPKQRKGEKAVCINSDLSDMENMLDDSGSAETETFPTDDDETEAFPSDQEEPDSTTNNPLLGNVQYHIQVLGF